MKSNSELLIMFILLVFSGCNTDEIPPEIPNDTRGWFTIDENNIGVNLTWSNTVD